MTEEQPDNTDDQIVLPPIPPNEEERLRELESFQILDTLPEQIFEDIVRIAAYICQTPIALVNLVDRHRQCRCAVGVQRWRSRAYSHVLCIHNQ